MHMGYSVYAACKYASEILKPTPTHDAGHGIGDSKCTGRRKTACPSRYTVSELLKFKHVLQHRDLPKAA